MRITEDKRKHVDLGELIRKLSEERGITRSELAEQAGVSISHLDKLETGLRRPGMNTFLKIMLVLDVTISLYDRGETAQEKCVREVREIIMDSTEEKAKYLTKMVECMSDNLALVM